MTYDYHAIPESAIPQAASPVFAHVVDIFAGETNKVASVWKQFSDADLDFRPHPRSTSVADIMKHQILSERRFFGEFLSAPEPAVDQLLPAERTVNAFTRRLTELVTARLAFLAGRTPEWWLEPVPFFDVERERIWIFWRRVLHTAHHRTQLTVYLRLLDKKVPSTYGPTADVSWSGADPTTTTESAGRK
ncbi:MAG TPA: DinB family protein [Bryobacteraceae bacterium]|nr:DinB family protein [Bryobacteraceae bacterium]